MLKVQHKMLLKKINNYIKMMHEKGIYTTLSSTKFQDEIKNFKNMNYKNAINITKYYQNFDKTINNVVLPEKIGLMLEKELNNPNYLIGCHRTSLDNNIFESEIAKSILKKGLLNMGDASSGSIRLNPNVTKTVSLFSNLFNSLPILKGTYKGSNGAFILKFPKNLVDEDGFVSDNDKIYNIINNNSYIKPEYIVGYLDNSFEISNFYTKEEILKKMYENNLEENKKVF